MVIPQNFECQSGHEICVSKRRDFLFLQLYYIKSLLYMGFALFAGGQCHQKRLLRFIALGARGRAVLVDS